MALRVCDFLFQAGLYMIYYYKAVVMLGWHLLAVEDDESLHYRINLYIIVHALYRSSH